MYYQERSVTETPSLSPLLVVIGYSCLIPTETCAYVHHY